MLDCECQHLHKLPSCFQMCVLFTCRLQLVATLGFSQAGSVGEKLPSDIEMRQRLHCQWDKLAGFITLRLAF